ncbi:UNVERIFIED_CONTAM: hypothetical protein FKN15_051498 [Acipenser sinensis]
MPSLQPAVAGVHDSRPPLSMPYASHDDHRHMASSSLSTSRTVTVCTSSVTHTSNTLPRFAAPAPHASPRMQHGGPFYPMVPGSALQQEQQSVFVPSAQSQDPIKQAGVPPSMQLSSISMMNGSQVHFNHGNKALPPNFSPAAIFNHFSSIFDNSQVNTNPVWGACHLPTRTPPDQAYNAPATYMSNMGQLENVLPPDGSKAPGYRSASQRIVTSPIDPNPECCTPQLLTESHAIMTPPPRYQKDCTRISQCQYRPGVKYSEPVLTGAKLVPLSRLRQQLCKPVLCITCSLHHAQLQGHSDCRGQARQVLVLPGARACQRGESPVPSVSSGTSSPLSASTTAPTMIQAKNSSSSQDRKVPPPIGTERLARIRQTGSVNPALLNTNYTAPVGHGGIWSFGVGSASEAMSGWSQPLMSNHMMHQQLSDQSAFSQHQPMERDDTGIVAPSNTFHQPMPSNFMDFPKGLPMSMYGGAMMPPHPTMAEGPGGQMYNGLHTADPAWNPILKVVPNSAENSDPQQGCLDFVIFHRKLVTESEIACDEKSCPIPTRVVHVKDWTQLPDRYSSTPGGTLFSTTPGGTRIIYERKFLLECRNSPLARTPPCCLPQIPGVTVPQHPPLSKLEELKEEEPDKDLPGQTQAGCEGAGCGSHTGGV